jgi:hypothetical protein
MWYDDKALNFDNLILLIIRFFRLYAPESISEEKRRYLRKRRLSSQRKEPAIDMQPEKVALAAHSGGVAYSVFRQIGNNR